MARTPNTESILEIATVWRDRCLIADGSMFSSEQLWTVDNAEELKRVFVDRPDDTDRKFDEKLQDQLASASPHATRLAAEMLWVLLLFPNNLRRETKVELVQRVWGWSGAAIPASHPAFQAMGIGIGSGGRSYNVRRPNELTLFIHAMQDWKARSIEERTALVSDPWSFATWFDTIPGADRRQFRHMLLHMLFPDTFERVSSGTDKESIDSEFRAELDGDALAPEEVATSLVARDRRLLHVRHALERKQPDVFVDFYLNSDLLNLWKPPGDPSEDVQKEAKKVTPPPKSRVSEKSHRQVGGYLEPTLLEIVDEIQSQLKLSLRMIRRYHLSLRSRGFVILAGVSGTGKTWLAEQYAVAVGARHLIVPVAPNWTTNEDLLGFTDPFTGEYRDTAFSRFLRDASAAADQARKAGHAPQPFHLILDEMNLARVEYYFAKFLSAMELRMRAGEARIELGPKDHVSLPANLYFAGTVNIDETTHGFSDKVYDRAQLIELPADRDTLDKHLGGAPYRAVIMEIWDTIHSVAPFAFRVLDDIGRYIASAETLGVKWEDLLDEQVLQKILPKLRGTDPRIGDALGTLREMTSDRFPLSHDKIDAMLERFRNHGFVSFF
jgi:hypothetical protein